MRSVEDFVQQLQRRYNGSLNFKRICDDEEIILTKAKLNEGVKGIYISHNGYRVIILNERISYEERRDWSYHELWHHFKSAGDALSNLHHSSKKEETKADLFAALCRAPFVYDGDTIETLMERYNVSRWLAKIRIEHEIKKENQ